MAHVMFAPAGQDACPACAISKGSKDPATLAACGIALGLASVAMADSAGEVGELMAQACPAHQERIAQFVAVYSDMAHVDFLTVMSRLGARPAGPGEKPTTIHVADGERTLCDLRALEEPWPDDERFVYRTRADQVTCPACRQALES